MRRGARVSPTGQQARSAPKLNFTESSAASRCISLEAMSTANRLNCGAERPKFATVNPAFATETLFRVTNIKSASFSRRACYADEKLAGMSNA